MIDLLVFQWTTSKKNQPTMVKAMVEASRPIVGTIVVEVSTEDHSNRMIIFKMRDNSNGTKEVEGTPEVQEIIEALETLEVEVQVTE